MWHDGNAEPGAPAPRGGRTRGPEGIRVLRRHRFGFVQSLAAALALAGVIGLAIVGPARADCTEPPRPGVDYSDCTFDRLDLSKVDLTGARLRDASFIRAELDGSTLIEVDAPNAKFISASLQNATLDRAKLVQSDFSRADLRGASFVGADLRSVEFYNADLRNVDLSGAKLEDTDLTGANLSGATWTGGAYTCREGSIGRCN